MNPEDIKKLVKEEVDKWLGKIPASFADKPLERNLYLIALELMNAKATNSFPDFIRRARKGDQIAEGALCIEAANRIKAGEKLEEPLAAYVVDLLAQRASKYKKPRETKMLGATCSP